MAYRPFFSTFSTVESFGVIPPPGYDDAKVTYFKRGPERTVRVELERDLPDGIELTVLRDDHADGSLEQAVTLFGRDRGALIDEYMAREGYNYRVENRRMNALYEYFLYGDIKDSLAMRGLW
jgi:hypothetical protein